MGGDIWKKGKVEKVMEFIERMKRVQEEAGTVLKKAQEEIKRQADKKKGDRRMGEGRQSNAKYKRLSIQRKTSQEVGRMIYGTI